jgi:hypothetical protein
MTTDNVTLDITLCDVSTKVRCLCTINAAKLTPCQLIILGLVQIPCLRATNQSKECGLFREIMESRKVHTGNKFVALRIVDTYTLNNLDAFSALPGQDQENEAFSLSDLRSIQTNSTLKVSGPMCVRVKA